MKIHFLVRESPGMSIAPEPDVKPRGRTFALSPFCFEDEADATAELERYNKYPSARIKMQVMTLDVELTGSPEGPKAG